jgi:FAD:protein FMN transferase
MSPRFYHILTLGLSILLPGCHRDTTNPITISGKAQGTTYNITYLAGEHSNYRSSFDSIFHQIDGSLSTYDTASLISRINRNDSTATVDAWFSDVYNKSMEVSGKTGGLFDITVAPVINAYGFGFTKRQRVTDSLIDSLLRFVGYKKLRLVDGKVVKEIPQVMLDFNAIAQGYTVDVVASFLESKGVKNYMVEVGGELRAKGKKLNDSSWTVGIEMPSENEAEAATLFARIRMDNKSLATSGNYKKFYVEDGKKYSHIINPFTGYPARNNLLSTTVIAEDCMTADAYATSFMVMGLEKSKQFLSENKDLGLEVFFIYVDNGVWKTYATKYFEEHREGTQF